MDATALRSQFPVFEERAYLNSGTCGPLPRRALHAVADVLARAAVEGRTRTYMETMLSLRDRQRAAYAERLGADPADVALTSSTSEGVVRVLAGLSLGPGDEVLTAPDEHPGLLGPLASLRARRGVDVRTAPFEDLADAVGRRTRLVACSHVNWVTGAVRPAGLAELGSRVPVLLDGAQGVGAVPIDVRALGCAFYAGSGQKWLCGPVGTGMLWIAPDRREDVLPIGATYMNLAEPGRGARVRRCIPTPAGTTRPRFRPRRPPRPSPPTTCSPRPAGTRCTSARGRSRPALADRLRERGRIVAAARRHHARLLGGRRPGGDARPPRGRRDHGPEPARHAVRARVGRGVERRARPRPTREGRGAGLSRAARGAGFATAVDAAAIGRVARRRRGSP